MNHARENAPPSASRTGLTWKSLVRALFSWFLWVFMALLVSSQFLGLFWSTKETSLHLMYGRDPTNPPSVIPGTNDEPYTDRSLVCMAQGRYFTPMQLSQVLADPKLAPVVDTTGKSISGYRMVKRETIQLDSSTSEHFSTVCERVDYSLVAIQDSCEKLGYNVTRESLLVVDGISSDTTKAIPRALPIVIMPFWDNGIYAHYAIPGWDGMACVFRLDGRYAIFDETISVLRAATRSVREQKTAEWLGKPNGTWRNGWYEDVNGQRWSSDMMSSEVGNKFGIEARQFDTLTNQEIDCVTTPAPRPCFDFPIYERWGEQSKTWDETKLFNQVYISNGMHFGLFVFEGKVTRVVENKYSLETFISNVSIFMLLFRWFVSMAIMVNSYWRGVAPWQSSGIGCLSSARSFNVLPIVLLPRLKMTLAAFWTVGCEFEGSQRALAGAWFAMYPAIVELMLLFYSVINVIAKIIHRRVDDILFGPTVVGFALLHYYRLPLATSGWLPIDDRIQAVIASDEFSRFNLLDMVTPSVALRMNGNIESIYYTKLLVLALNLLPLVFSENMTRSGKKCQSYAICEIEKALALRASNVGGLGKSVVYSTLLPMTILGLVGPQLNADVSTGRRSSSVVDSLLKLKLKTITTRVAAFESDNLAVNLNDGRTGVWVKGGENGVANLPSALPPRHVLVAFELDRLGYLVFGGKYLITYDDWYILTTMAPLRVLQKLWNHRISVFEVVASDEGYLVSSTARLFRIDDDKLRSIPLAKRPRTERPRDIKNSLTLWYTHRSLCVASCVKSLFPIVMNACSCELNGSAIPACRGSGQERQTPPSNLAQARRYTVGTLKLLVAWRVRFTATRHTLRTGHLMRGGGPWGSIPGHNRRAAPAAYAIHSSTFPTGPTPTHTIIPMSAVDFSNDESDWVFDYVMHLFRSPAWEVPVMCFIDENCASFDTSDENKFIYTDLHLQFRDVVEGVLCANLAEIGLTASDFADICERGRHSTDISMEVVNQILAMDDFLTFKKLMVKRNLELDLEAIKALRDENLEGQEDADADENDMDTHLMELSVLYKQEEMEQAELEAAIAMSLAVQEEQLRLAAVASKVAEDKYDVGPEKKGLSPEQVQQQIKDTKQRASELVKRNKEALQENKIKQKELQNSAEIPDDEIKRREEYLRQQRDRILEKKKKEREAQLKEYQQEQKVSAPEPPPELVEKLQNVTPEELKKSEAEEKRNALRIALARRMKQDLLESATEEPSGGFKVQQLMELDEKMQRVEDLRRRSQEREQRVHSRQVR